MGIFDGQAQAGGLPCHSAARYGRGMTEYVIERLGHQGDGIAAGPVFAPLTLPGETVTGELIGTRLENVRVTTPSENRVRPACRHFKTCGGCQLMHAADEFVAEWKAGVVHTALAAQGISAPFRPIMTPPTSTPRRASSSCAAPRKDARAGVNAAAPIPTL